MQKLFHLDEDAAKHEADTNESMNALREGPRLDWAKDVDHQAVIRCVKQTETHPKDGHKGKQNWERTGLFAKVETNKIILDECSTVVEIDHVRNLIECLERKNG